MNTLSLERKAQILSILSEGVSIRATERLTHTHRDTICRLLMSAGQKCQALMDCKLQGIEAESLQCDEIHCFVAKRDKNLNGDKNPEHGSQFAFVGLEAKTKLILSFSVGKRDWNTAIPFMQDLQSRLKGRPQLTTDAFRGYTWAVDLAFGSDVDYAQLSKVCHGNGGGREGYSPGDLVDIVKTIMTGKPDRKRISTSYIERQNLTIRMACRRFTRLTNAFSKKLANLKGALAIHFCWYNFGRVHQTLRVTPAMEAGITDHIWTWEEILDWSN